MRAIVIDPKSRTIYELPFHMAPDFMSVIAGFIGSNALGLDVAPPHTAMFLDAIGFLRDQQAFWRQIDGQPHNNVAGVGIMFGLAPDGKLADLPAEITVESVSARTVWADDVIESTVERMEIVDFPNGKAPRINRTVVWRPGAVTPAGTPAPVQAAEVAGDADVYSQGSPPAPAAPPAATSAAAKAPAAAPAASLAPIWAIHETPDNRFRVIEYEVTEKGLGAPLSLATVPNLDAARAKVPKGLLMRPAEDDIEDDTLVETWS